MPAEVVVVFDDRERREAAVQALREAGLDVAAFDNSMSALIAIEQDSKARMVVSSVNAPPGKLGGVALLRMLRYKQLILNGKSELCAVLVGRAEDREFVEEGDECLYTAFDPKAVVAAVKRMLRPKSAVPLRMTGEPMIWEGLGSVAEPARQARETGLSSRTDRLLREAWRTIQHTAVLRQWRLVQRPAFAARF